ncbi:MAG TPA: DMT family transporter [Vicinamibacteria bacterium]|nr:DMT family transporter [Vicinamibacteria bacterium]
MLRVLVAMSAACISAAVGQILVRRGMLELGPLESYAPAQLLVYFGHVVVNPWVIAGTVLNTVFYLLFIAVLSWTGVSVALPLTALEYLAAAVLGVLFLKEVVPPLRWAGIGLVVLGVALISYVTPEARAAAAGAQEKEALHEHLP